MALNEVDACFTGNTASKDFSPADAIAIHQNRECPRRKQDRVCLNPVIDSVLICLAGSRKQNRAFLDKLADEIIQLKCTIEQDKNYNESSEATEIRRRCEIW